ncbi:MAG: type II toxin-antitoxin system VapC family toxin [Thermomicrobiales bacterium]|nr:type II toxin-antitoxin system VapC family toxin [Thermomicrobiales bacterium]
MLDTCVLIELQRPRGDERVRTRVAELHQRQVFISVISVGELTRGIALIRDDETRVRRAMAWLDDLLARYADHILPLDLEVCQLWGELTAAAGQRGHTIPASDGQIAATARRYGLSVMTRNERHFRESGVEIENPWDN